MTKEFNITGTCNPEMHYMVDISGKLDRIIPLIEKGQYFTINRPRQYGKTTTLFLLENRLNRQQEFLVLSISFEGIGDAGFTSERSFIEALFRQFRRCLSLQQETALLGLLEENKILDTLDQFGDFLTELVLRSGRRVVLMVDEVDRSSNNQLFLNFLGLLRNKYLLRSQKKDLTFHSVILAGVHDVKSLKLKVRPDEEQKYKSPWNIAVDFDVDLSFSSAEIATMLSEYIRETGFPMDISFMSHRLHYLTSGYPFLVSKLCKLLDEKIQGPWVPEQLDQAVKELLKESNTNFDSLIKNLENHQGLAKIVSNLLIDGMEISYNIHNPEINLGVIFGIFKNEEGLLKIHNRIYEQLIYDYLSSKIQTTFAADGYNTRKSYLDREGYLDFPKILLKFQEFMKELYSERDGKFIEETGRLLFLAFIKPIINNKGFDFKEVQISEEKRLDVVITYLDRKYVVELKIWRGQKAHESGIRQLQDYMVRVGLKKGYLVIFDLRKTSANEWKQEQIVLGSEEIFTVWV